MTRFRQGRTWRCALSAGAACGMALMGAAMGADSPNDPDARTVSGEVELDAAFQTLGVLTTKVGNSSSTVRKQAINDLLVNDLPEASAAKVHVVLNNLAMFRRLPTLSFEADPDVYTYFLHNPDVAVSTWRAMEISKFQLKEVEPHCYDADAGDGSIGRIEILRQTPSETLIHCDGAFKSPLVPRPITARALMRLQTTFTKEPDGRLIGSHSGDVFVEFPSQAVETVAKVISPISHSIADRNFKQITLFAHLMTQAMARHPGWIEQIGNKLDGVSPTQRQQFLEVSARSHVMSRKRMAIGQLRPFAPDEVLSPFRLNEGSSQIPSPIVIRPVSNSRD